MIKKESFMENKEIVKIELEVLNAVISYIAGKAYHEVAHLITAVQESVKKNTDQKVEEVK